MGKSNQHSRRDFLRGKAAARTLAAKAQGWVDATSEILDVASEAALHLQLTRRAMACEFAVQFHEEDHDASEAMLYAFDLIEQLETQMTIYRDSSEVLEINRHAASEPVEVESYLFSLLELATKINRETDGAFDITSSPLSQAWGFLQREGRFPGAEQIAAALGKVGGDRIQLDSEQQTIRFLEPEIEINLNSIGKGFALDRAASQLDKLGVIDYLWHGGGSSVLARGRNRADRKEVWTLGLQHPLKPGYRIAEFHLRNQALATAGGGTQFFEHEGRRLSHIIDPRTGWPIDDVLTATAIAPSASEADALATAFFVMGVEQATAYCAAHPEIGGVLVCPNSAGKDIAVHDFGLAADSWTRL